MCAGLLPEDAHTNTATLGIALDRAGVHVAAAAHHLLLGAVNALGWGSFLQLHADLFSPDRHTPPPARFASDWDTGAAAPYLCAVSPGSCTCPSTTSEDGADWDPRVQPILSASAAAASTAAASTAEASAQAGSDLWTAVLGPGFGQRTASMDPVRLPRRVDCADGGPVAERSGPVAEAQHARAHARTQPEASAAAAVRRLRAALHQPDDSADHLRALAQLQVAAQQLTVGAAQRAGGPGSIDAAVDAAADVRGRAVLAQCAGSTIAWKAPAARSGAQARGCSGATLRSVYAPHLDAHSTTRSTGDARARGMGEHAAARGGARGREAASQGEHALQLRMDATERDAAQGVGVWQDVADAHVKVRCEHCA